MNKLLLTAMLGLGGLLIGGPARADRFDGAWQPGWQRGEYDRGDYRPVYVPAHGFRYGRGNALRFIRHIRGEVRTVVSDIRFDVDQGVVRPDVFGALTAGEQEIERDLRSASAKGFFTPDDRMHLEGHVNELRWLRDQFRADGSDSDDGDRYDD